MVADGVTEGLELEYAEDHPSGTDADQKDFLAEVSALANAQGGDLVFGIREEDETAAAADVVGIQSAALDLVVGPMESRIRSGIEPRIQGLELKRIPLSNGRGCLIVRVPQSRSAPHMVTYKGTRRFWSRSSAGKYPMDVAELRSAFEQAGQATESLRNFRSDRLLEVLRGNTPVPLEERGLVMVHLVPMSALVRPRVFDLTGIPQRNWPFPLGGGAFSFRYNFDGLLSWNIARGDQPLAYAQVFRTGVIEAVDTLVSFHDSDIIPGTGLFKDLSEALPNYLAFQRDQLGVQLPVYLLVGLVRVKGYQFAVSRTGTHPLVDRDNLLPPEVVLDRFDADPKEALRPILDAFWNAIGFPRWEERRG